MAGKELLIDLAQIDLTQTIANIEEIRRYNPQRFEMEQLTAVIYCSEDHHSCVGYKDVTENDFWVRGHMPGMPLMPGVVMLEAVAQLCSWVTQRHDLLGAEMVGFGGLEEVRFPHPVIPGDRLYLLCKLEKVRRGKIIISRFQGVVNYDPAETTVKIAVEGVLKGIAIPVEALRKLTKSS